MSGLRVLHCDNHLLVVEKPACQPMVPDDSGDESLFDQSAAWVAAEFEKPGRAYLGVVHRLDRPVSGVVVFARTSKAASRLTAQFADRRAEKTYLGVTGGRPTPPQGRMEQWLEKDADRNRVEVRAAEAAGAKRALTRWRELEPRGPGALVELIPETGRSHQLRVALASLGAPLLGDLKYGAAEPLPDRSIALHALALAFDHPTRDERMQFTCDPPDRPWWRPH